MCATCVHTVSCDWFRYPGQVPAHCCRSVYFCKLAGTWDFLCVRCGGSTSKQRGPSGLPAAPVTGGLVLLQTSCWGQNSVQTNTGSQTMVHWNLGKTSTLCINVGWLMLTQTCLQTCFSSTYIKCQWISGSYGLSGVSFIPFLEKLDIEESLVQRQSTRLISDRIWGTNASALGNHVHKSACWPPVCICSCYRLPVVPL